MFFSAVFLLVQHFVIFFLYIFSHLTHMQRRMGKGVCTNFKVSSLWSQMFSIELNSISFCSVCRVNQSLQNWMSFSCSLKSFNTIFQFDGISQATIVSTSKSRTETESINSSALARQQMEISIFRNIFKIAQMCRWEINCFWDFVGWEIEFV